MKIFTSYVSPTFKIGSRIRAVDERGNEAFVPYIRDVERENNFEGAACHLLRKKGFEFYWVKKIGESKRGMTFEAHI